MIENDEDKKIEIKIVRSKIYVNELRNVFAIPEKYSDKKILEVLVNDIVERYLSTEYILPEDVQNMLTDNVDENWLYKTKEKKIGVVVEDLIKTYNEELQTLNYQELEKLYEERLQEKIKIVE